MRTGFGCTATASNQIIEESKEEKMSDTLYSRLGGYDALATFATMVVGNAQRDDVLSRFWAHRNEDSNDRDLQSLIDYLVNQTGGQMYYRGRDMALAHKGMGINDSDWARFIEIVTSGAEELGVGAVEGGEVLAFLGSLKGDIVTA